MFRCLGDMLSKLSERYVGDMLRCLGDILAFFSGNVSCIFVSGKMSERHVKMSWRHLGIFQGKCLRDMFRCLGDFFFLTGKMPERYVKICGRHHEVC